MKPNLPAAPIHAIQAAIDESVACIKRSASDLESWVRQETPVLTSAAKVSFQRGKDVTSDAADAVVRSAKAHPVFYLLAGIGLVTVVIALAAGCPCCNKKRQD